jgi:hypothetical protein
MSDISGLDTLGDDLTLVLLTYLSGKELGAFGFCSKARHGRVFEEGRDVWQRCRRLECWAEPDLGVTSHHGDDQCGSGGGGGGDGGGGGGCGEDDAEAAAAATARALTARSVTRWRRSAAAHRLSSPPRWRQLGWSGAPSQEGHACAVLCERWIVTINGFTGSGISNAVSVLDGARLLHPLARIRPVAAAAAVVVTAAAAAARSRATLA